MSMQVTFGARFFINVVLWVCCVVFLYPLKKKSDYPVRFWLAGAAASAYVQTKVEILLIFQILYAFVSCVWLLYFLCRERKSVILYCSFWSMMSAQLILQLWNVLEGFADFGENWLLTLLWCTAGVVVLHYTLARWLPGEKGYDVGPRKLSLSGVTFLAFECCEILILGREDMTSLNSMLLILTQVYFITVLYMQNALFQKSAMKHELDTMNLLWRQQKEQYELSKENIAIINRKCHDLKHQIAALRVMGSSEERDKYIRELQTSLNIYDSVVRTGNEALDTLLTEKSLYCEANDIKINCVVDGKQMSFIDAVDLYTIMGNAVDNAIESVKDIKEQEKRIIDVLVYVKQNFLMINIINPLDHEIMFEDGVPVTTKENNGYHGFGTKSIRHTAAKYNGHTSFQTENGCFVLKILFPLDKNFVDHL